MMLGFIPSGMVLGAFCVNKGFPVWGVPMLTGLNFAGGSEFASVALWTMPPNILLSRLSRCSSTAGTSSWERYSASL